MRSSSPARRASPGRGTARDLQSGPVLLPVPPLRPRPHSPLALWHLLSLDAPTVAALWTMFIARCASLTLRWAQIAAMFVAVWMIYAADRLLDARLLDGRLFDARPLDARPLPDAAPGLEARHRFHHRHRSGFLAVIVIASLTLVFLLQRIPRDALDLYALLAALLAAWLLLIHARPTPTAASHRLPKELAVGVFFPAAVFVPTVSRDPSLRAGLLPAAVLFAAVCTLNCLFLYAWEHPAPSLEAHWTTRWATVHLTHLALLVVASSALLALAGALHPHSPLFSLSRWPALASALTAALLLILDRLRHRFSAVHLRASADLVLLTPLLLMALIPR